MILVGILAGAFALHGCASVTDTEHDFDLLATPPETAPEPQPVPSAPASPAPSGPVAPLVVKHGMRDMRRVALTFDACATKSPSHYDERVAKILVDENVPATIFLGGKWMEEHPEATRFLASLPQFELANHSYLHPHMTAVSDERAREEMQHTQETLQALTGRQATLFRAPYGEITPHLVALAAEAGMATVQFDLASGDADKNISKEKLVEYVSTMAKNGSIVVMHINGRGWHTAEVLPEIITRLRGRGFEFVTVSELIAAPAEQAAPAKLPPTPPTAGDGSHNHER